MRFVILAFGDSGGYVSWVGGCGGGAGKEEEKGEAKLTFLVGGRLFFGSWMPLDLLLGSEGGKVGGMDVREVFKDRLILLTP